MILKALKNFDILGHAHDVLRTALAWPFLGAACVFALTFYLPAPVNRLYFGWFQRQAPAPAVLVPLMHDPRFVPALTYVAMECFFTWVLWQFAKLVLLLSAWVRSRAASHCAGCSILDEPLNADGLCERCARAYDHWHTIGGAFLGKKEKSRDTLK